MNLALESAERLKRKILYNFTHELEKWADRKAAGGIRIVCIAE